MFPHGNTAEVGTTEGKLEHNLHVVEAPGYVLLIIDERDDGPFSRVVARLWEFMSDTDSRVVLQDARVPAENVLGKVNRATDGLPGEDP